MAPKIHHHQENEAARFFYFLCKILYVSSGYNFWFEDLNFGKTFVKIYNIKTKIVEVFLFYFVVSGWGALFTQKHLTQPEKNGIFMNGIPHTCAYVVFYVSIVYYRQELHELVFTLVVRLKRMSNDETTERMTIKSTRRYLVAGLFLVSFASLSNGAYSAAQSITTNSTFTTIVPMWPDVEDRRLIAGITRVFYYILWWIFASYVLCAHVMIIAITIYLSYQFKIVCKYFENLKYIFEGSGSQIDKERKYEEDFITGIKIHYITLRCVKQLQLVGNVTFSSQVIISIFVVMLAMLRMMSLERTLLAMISVLFTAATALILTAAFMWNAGDVTIEIVKTSYTLFSVIY